METKPNFLNSSHSMNISFLSLQKHDSKIDESLLHELLNEVDLNKNGEIDLNEFFQVSSFQSIIVDMILTLNYLIHSSYSHF